MCRFWAVALVCLASASAWANPHPLPFSYPYATLPKDGIEVEEYVDLTPVSSFDTTGARVLTPRAVLTTELEYGLTDKLELALYFQFSNDPGASSGEVPLRMDGLKQRLRYRLAEAGEWPVNVGLYFELAELRNEFEIEGKILLERRLGPWQLLVNLWFEHEFYFNGVNEWVLNPTAGASYEFSPMFQVGVEYWMHGEYGGNFPSGSFNPDEHHYVGPALLLQLPKLFWVVGTYVRLDNWERDSQVGDLYGRIWVRTMIGFNL